MLLQQPRVNHTKRRTNNTLPRQRRQPTAGLHTIAALIDSVPQDPQHLPAARKDPRPRTEGLHEHQPAERRLTIKETQQRAEARTDTRIPPALSLPRREHDPRDLIDRMVKCREEAVFAIGEQVIERLARDTRTVRDPPRSQPPITILSNHSKRRVQQTHTLKPRHIHPTTPRTRDTPTTHPHTPSGEAINTHPPQHFQGASRNGKRRAHRRDENDLKAAGGRPDGHRN